MMWSDSFCLCIGRIQGESAAIYIPASLAFAVGEIPSSSNHRFWFCWFDYFILFFLISPIILLPGFRLLSWGNPNFCNLDVGSYILFGIFQVLGIFQSVVMSFLRSSMLNVFWEICGGDENKYVFSLVPSFFWVFLAQFDGFSIDNLMSFTIFSNLKIFP